MTLDMFFLKIIADALQKSDRKKALKEGFDEIEQLGSRPEYQQGFKQFQVFMMEIRRHIDDPMTTDTELNALLEEIQLQLISGVLQETWEEEQACLELINAHPGWKKRFERLFLDETKAEVPEGPVTIIIDKDGKPYRTIAISKPFFIQSLKNIGPGQYRFRLETGRLIGEEDLTKNDLLWGYAYPGENLRLAADTGYPKPRPKRTIKLLNGEVNINVFPGIDSGRLELEIRGQNE